MSTQAALSDYLSKNVAASIDHDYQDADLERRKALFMLEEAGVDPGDVIMLERSDGKIDAYELQDDGDGHLTLEIWQLSGPAIKDIRKGKVKSPPSKKLQND